MTLEKEQMSKEKEMVFKSVYTASQSQRNVSNFLLLRFYSFVYTQTLRIILEKLG